MEGMNEGERKRERIWNKRGKQRNCFTISVRLGYFVFFCY